MGTINRQIMQILQVYHVQTTSQNLLDYEHLKTLEGESIVSQAFKDSLFLAADKSHDILNCQLQDFPDFDIKITCDKVDQGLLLSLAQPVKLEDALKDRDQCYWQVARKGIEDSLPLEIGDVLKIGRHKLVISGLLASEIKSTESLDQSIITQDLLSKSAVCRICYESAGDLLDICGCTGSMKYIHRDCIKEWVVNQAKQSVSTKSKSFAYTSYCQICGSSFRLDPAMFFQERRLGEPHLVLEHQKDKKSFVIVTPASRVVIGRNMQASFILKDISISRSHCTITYNDGEIRVTDHGSKFGTLKLVRSVVKLDYGSEHWLQKGEYFVKIKQQSKVNCELLCCEGQQIDQHQISQI